MTQRATCWSFILLAIFILVLAATGYFALQGHRSAPPAPAGFLAADKGYGVTVDLTQYDQDTLTNTLTSLRENGLTWLHQPVSWAEIEPNSGQFDWQQFDRVVAAVAHENEETGDQYQDFKLVVVLHTSPTWAKPANTPLTTPPTEVSDFGNFARTFAARYGQQVDHYQIWHEPNLSANWGNAFVDPAAYADLLREAALNIRAVDPEAYILNAALAPTLENGPLNLNEIAYLEQLYQAKADRWFDIVAIQPYGFDSEPSNPAGIDVLDFRRAELLRQVMLEHNDADTPLWATAFGWNVLPADWAGQPAPWHSDTASVQAQRTAAAIQQARRDWPWLGPMLAIRWDTTGLTADDPGRGFALLETPVVLAAIQTAATNAPLATAGRYPADHPSGRYSPGWRFALTEADIPRDEPRTLTISFEGTRLDLTVNRGPYRGYLWVTIDDQPAEALPRNGRGRSYVVLYDPLRESETIPLAQNLTWGQHQAVIEAEGGWGQWAVSGWTVYNEADRRPAQTGLVIAGVLAVLSGLGWLWSFFRAPVEMIKLAWAWSEILVALYAILREPGQIVLTFVLTIGFYLAPGTIALAILPLLALVILLRPDLGLAVVAFSLSFFQAPKQLPVGGFSPVELALALTVAGFIFRALLALGQAVYAPEKPNPEPPTSSNLQFPISTPYSLLPTLKSADWAALALVVLALLATLAADNFGVSMHEWRVVVFESVLFYFLVRLGVDFSPFWRSSSPPDPPKGGDFSRCSPFWGGRRGFGAGAGWRWAWRLVDAFVAGAVLQAFIALYLYFFTDQSITAEGVRRALGLAYGSPNNLSLFLDRAWPILLAVTVLPGTETKYRRWLYGAGLVIVSLALYLTFSKGALLIGLPACIVAMAILHVQRNQTAEGQRKRRSWGRVVAATAGGLVIIILVLIPLSQTERFRTTFDFNQGSTGFFRLKLWQASLAMLRDHWPLGVGLDNFLYQYRTRYILPEAWQEPNLSHPHNLILDFGTRLGLGGIALLLWLQGAFWLAAWRLLYQKQPAPLILGLMGSMVVFLSHGLVDNSYFLVDLAFAFFLTVGIVQRLTE